MISGILLVYSHQCCVSFVPLPSPLKVAICDLSIKLSSIDKAIFGIRLLNTRLPSLQMQAIGLANFMDMEGKLNADNACMVPTSTEQESMYTVGDGGKLLDI